MPDWLVWLVLAGILAVGEMATLTLFLGPVALAAALTAAVAALGVPLAGQLVVFIAGSLASLLFLRPVARRHLRTPPKTRTGIPALVGQTAIVVERVDAHSGQVKLAGELWSARAMEGAGTFEPGMQVHVVEITGATAVVMG